MYDHITSHSLLTDKQSECRRNRSTELQSHYLTHNLYKSLNSRRDFTSIYFDIWKCFDEVWHRELVDKQSMENEFGTSSALLNFLKSYSKDRTQWVWIRNSFSQQSTINAGCPQGSALGSFLAIYLSQWPLQSHTKRHIFFFVQRRPPKQSNAHGRMTWTKFINTDRYGP